MAARATNTEAARETSSVAAATTTRASKAKAVATTSTTATDVALATVAEKLQHQLLQQQRQHYRVMRPWQKTTIAAENYCGRV